MRGFAGPIHGVPLPVRHPCGVTRVPTPCTCRKQRDQLGAAHHHLIGMRPGETPEPVRADRSGRCDCQREPGGTWQPDCSGLVLRLPRTRKIVEMEASRDLLRGGVAVERRDEDPLSG